jgi:hypothetical protein
MNGLWFAVARGGAPACLFRRAHDKKPAAGFYRLARHRELPDGGAIVEPAQSTSNKKIADGTKGS